MGSKQHVHAIIEVLEHMRKRPAMYLGRVDGRAAMNFVHGMRVAAHALGLGQGLREAGWKAEQERGWRFTATGTLPQMEERGMSDKEMADEVLAIEIRAWQLLIEETSAQDVCDGAPEAVPAADAR